MSMVPRNLVQRKVHKFFSVYRVRFQNGFLEVRGCNGDQINLSKKMWMKIKAPIMLKASNLVTEVKEEKLLSLAMIQDYVRVLKLTETHCM
jgi:hypothetical protein